MKTTAILAFVYVIAGATCTGYSAEKATPMECVEKCREARAYLQENAAAGEDALKKAIAYMHQRQNRFVWKDTYVYIACCECSPVCIVSHPIKPKLVGPDLSGLKDKTGNLFFLELCEAAKNPEGKWVEYWWPKIGESKASRKLSFILNVPGTKYQVVAGVYDENTEIASLNKMLEKNLK